MNNTKRIQLSNQLAIAFAIVMSLWAMIVLAVERQWTIPLWDAAIAACITLVPILNERGYTRVARNWLVLCVNGTLFLFPALFGEASGTHYCFLPATVLPFALFSTREKGSLSFGVLLPMALFALIVGSDFRLFPRYAELPPGTWVFWLTVACAFLISVLSIYLFARASERAEEELRLSEQKYSQIVELAQEGIWVIDSQGVTTYSNPALAQMLGYPAAELIGKSVFDFVEESSMSNAREGLERRTRGHTERLDFPLRRKDGRVIDTLVSASPVKGADGSVVGAVALVMDVSETRAKERLIEEQRAKMIAAAKLSSLGEMAGGIGHEINNPLTALNIKIALLERKFGESLNDDVRRILKDMLEVIDRIAAIISGLKSFSREDDGSPMQPVPVSKLIEDTLSFCRQRFRAQGVTLEVTPVSEDLEILARPVQISQVLLNLLNNAFDAVHGTPVRIISIDVAARDGGAEVSVADSGPGIRKDALDKIFHPFFTTKPVGQGTGLGLSISRGIVEAHRGELTHSVSKWGGACFTIRLPGPKRRDST